MADDNLCPESAMDTHRKSIGYILWLFGFGILYDFWTLNDQISAVNRG